MKQLVTICITLVLLFSTPVNASEEKKEPRTEDEPMLISINPIHSLDMPVLIHEDSITFDVEAHSVHHRQIPVQ